MFIVKNNLIVVQPFAMLAINRIIAQWRSRKSCLVTHYYVFPSWSHITQKQGTVTIATSGIIVALWRIGTKIHPHSETSKPSNVAADLPRIKTMSADSTDTTPRLRASRIAVCKVTAEYSAVEVCFCVLISKRLGVRSKLGFQCLVVHFEYLEVSWSWHEWRFHPLSGEGLWNLLEVQCMTVYFHNHWK